MTTLPTGLKVRPFRMDTDVSPLLHLLAETEAVDDSGELFSEELLRIYLTLPGHDPATDRWVIEHPENKTLIGHAVLRLPTETDDRRVADGMLVVHPLLRRQGLGHALFPHVETRLEHSKNVAELRFYLDPRHEGAVAFAKSQGFEPNPTDTYTEMHAVLEDVTAQPVLPEGFTLRCYREVDHLPTLLEALNRGFEGLLGHHHSTETEFAPRLAELDQDGLFILFAPDGSAAGEVGGELAPDLTERNGVRTGRVDAPSVVPERRSLELYQALLLSGVAYLKGQNAVQAELKSWGDAPRTLELYASLGFVVRHKQIAYGRPVR